MGNEDPEGSSGCVGFGPLVFAAYLYGGMYKLSYYTINAITLYRLTVTPLLGFLAVDHQLGLFKWLLAVSFFTDAIDGYLYN